MKPNRWPIAAVGAFGILACLVLAAEPATAIPAAVPENPSDILLTGCAGDTPNTQNLIYVVHKRPMTERERTILRALDGHFPDHRVTLLVYRASPNGMIGRNGTSVSLLYMQDITLMEMQLGSTQQVVDEIIAAKKWMNDQVDRITQPAGKPGRQPPP